MKAFRLLFYCIVLLLQVFTITAQHPPIQHVEDSLLNLIAQTNNDTIKVKEYLTLSRMFFFSDAQRALKYTHASIKESRKLQYKRGIADGLDRIVGVHLAMGTNLDTTFKHLKIYEDFVNEIGDSSKMASVFVKYAVYYGRIGKSDKELEYHLKALQYIRKFVEDPAAEVPVLYNIGVALSHMEQWEKALEYFEAVKTKEHNFPLLNAQVEGQLGIVYWEQKAFTKSRLHYESALKMFEAKNAISQVITACLALGKLHDALGEFQVAEQYYLRANQQAIESKIPILPTIYDGFASHFYSQKKYAKAVEYGEKYLQSKTAFDQLATEQNLLHLLHQSYAKLGRYEEAYKVHQDLVTFKDSVQNSEHQLKFSELETKFQVAEQKTKNQLLEAENTIGKDRLRNTQLISFALLLALLLAGGWGYSIFKARQLEKQHNEELRSLDEAKTRFFSNISHEFKTPLTLIINPISRLLQSSRLNEEDKFLAKSAEQNSLQLLELTNQVLELTKFEVNKVTTNPIVFNLKQAANKLYADFESLAVSKKIQFERQIEINEQLNVNIDYTKFTTIIKNLISNAIKFTPENGQVTLKVIEKTTTIEVQVKDTGRGIHASDLPHIFDRYYQAKITNQIQEGGTGIGLSICAEYAKLLHGDLQVQSEYGQGSTFILILPKIVASTDAIPNQLFQQKNTIDKVILNKKQYKMSIF